MIKITDSSGKVLLETQGPITLAEVATVPVDPKPPPTGWKVDFFGNLTLTGTPASTRYYDDLNFNWGLNKPIDEVGIDNFSVRATRAITTEASWYAITVSVDDGVRVYVDGSLVIDAWKDQVATYTEKRQLTAGNHAFVVEFYEHGGAAKLQFSLEKTTAPVVEPPKPPAPTSKPILGMNNVKDGNSGRAALAAGVQAISTTFNPQWAAEIKQAFPNVKVGVRGLLYGGYTPSIDEWWSKIWQGAVNGNYMIGLNENDHGVGTSAADIRARIAFDKAALARTKYEAAKKGIVLYYCGGGFSVGCPDITDDGVIRAMAGYAELMEDPYFRFNQHSYACNDGGKDTTPAKIRDLIFDESFGDVESKRWNVKTQQVEPFIERVYRVEWTILRWRMYYRRCGWRPDAPGKVVSDETGLDIGSVGGFSAMDGCDDAFMQRWARKFIWWNSQPLIVNGILYAPPIEWSDIFQSGDFDRWAGYDIKYKLGALQACSWGQA